VGVAEPVNDPLQMLLAALDLGIAEPDGFEGRSVETERPRIFGGELLAHSLVAAARTVEGQGVRALHVHFLSPGDPARPVLYRVRRVRDGRRVALRQVSAWQGGREIALGVVSFAVDFADAFTYQHVPMPEVEGPEGRRSELEERLRVADRFRDEDRRWLLTPRAVEVRQVRPVPLLDPPPSPPLADTWLRAVGRLPDDPVLHAAVLAYASDLTLLDVACQPRGLSWIDPRMEQASLDHVMWFHRPFRMDEWVLYAQAALSLGAGRALVRGSVFTRKGTLAVTVVQEGLSRLAAGA
jgi:acyl-CoA thioesterase-2